VIEIESFSSSVKDENYRAELELFAKENGNEALHQMLAEVDAQSASEIHPNNTKRVIRALEIFKCTKVPKSEWDKRSREQAPPYDSTVLFLTCKDRAVLVERIEKRVDIMLEQGLLDEARYLYENGYLNEKYTSYSAIGYKELLPYLKGEDTLENCVERLKISTRQYAKRQLTWFGRRESYNKIYVDEENALESALKILK
jgi:tRNA dimethylallyltransferase